MNQINQTNNSINKRGIRHFDPETYENELPHQIKNAICVMSDKNEGRVVFVGSNDAEDNFRKRLGEYFQGKGKCSMRKSIAEALSHKQGYPVSEDDATNYIRQNMTFVVIEVNGEEKRKNLKNRLIATFAQNANNQPTKDWLGKYSSNPKIANGKLWNAQNLNGETLDDRMFKITHYGTLVLSVEKGG